MLNCEDPTRTKAFAARCVLAPLSRIHRPGDHSTSGFFSHHNSIRWKPLYDAFPFQAVTYGCRIRLQQHNCRSIYKVLLWSLCYNWWEQNWISVEFEYEGKLLVKRATESSPSKSFVIKPVQTTKRSQTFASALIDNRKIAEHIPWDSARVHLTTWRSWSSFWHELLDKSFYEITLRLLRSKWRVQ